MHVRMLKAQEVAVSQLVVAEVRHRVTTVVEQYEGCHPLRILKSEIIIMSLKNSTNKKTATLAPPTTAIYSPDNKIGDYEIMTIITN